jgi:sodium-coupled neutral amino acid transporter 11
MDHKKSGTSLFLTVANATKTILGSGILSLSWAFFYSTMWPGVIFTVLIGLLSAHNYVLLGRCSEITTMPSYSAIWTHAFGAGWAWLPELAVAGICLLGSITYLMIVGDYLPLGLAGIGINWAPLQQREAAILLVSAMLLPLHFMQDLSFLGYTSILGSAGALYTCGVLVLEAAEHRSDQADWEPCHLGPGVFLMIPTVTFTFMGHFNAPDLYQQLERRSFARWALVTSLAYGFCLMIVMTCAVTGYVLFGSDLALEGRSNVLTAPEFQGRPEVMAAYLATTVSVAFSVPLCNQAARDAMERLLLRALPEKAGERDRRSEETRRSLLSLLCVVLTLAASMALSHLGLVCAIAGAVTASLLMFVFPSMMYLRCVSVPADGFSGLGLLVHRGLPMLSITIGIVVGVLGSVTALLQEMGVDLNGLRSA